MPESAYLSGKRAEKRYNYIIKKDARHADIFFWKMIFSSFTEMNAMSDISMLSSNKQNISLRSYSKTSTLFILPAYGRIVSPDFVIRRMSLMLSLHSVDAGSEQSRLDRQQYGRSVLFPILDLLSADYKNN